MCVIIFTTAFKACMMSWCSLADFLFFFFANQVKHSQRVSLPPLLPWVVCEQEGEIIHAHCTCMAGYVILRTA